MSAVAGEARITGRCYCGAISIVASRAPRTVAYCHCADCRRVTGAPVAAFAAFDEGDVTFTPNEGRAVSIVEGVERRFCPACGSPISGRYGYLPGQVFVSLGLLDQAAELAPALHAHAGEALPWLRIDDALERFEATSRDVLDKPDA